MARKKELPKLPRGEGTMSYEKNGKIRYRKNITNRNGNTQRVTVTCDSVSQCFKEMEKMERKINVKKSAIILADELLFWFETIKKPVLREQSSRRLKGTVNLISGSRIGHQRYQSISSEDIQLLISILNGLEYDYSSIKKVYDCLNAFYRYVCARDDFKNPMSLVVMPTKDNIEQKAKEAEWLEKEDIDKFLLACKAKYKNGRLVYRYGYILGANIYLGLRIGELLALKWYDINLDDKVIRVDKTMIEKEISPGKTKFVIQKTTKTRKIRYVPINDKAEELIRLHMEKTGTYRESDFVVCTRSGIPPTPKHMGDTVKAIQKRGKTTVQGSGTHILRHTCASLYFKAGVPLLVIAQILGNSVEVLEKTYVHLIEEQLKEAAKKIENYNI